jgi:hypothetical protein
MTTLEIVLSIVIVGLVIFVGLILSAFGKAVDLIFWPWVK